MYEIDHTHNPELKSWIQTANATDSDFPIQNLPFCVFRKSQQTPRIGVGIGDQILDLKKCTDSGFFPDGMDDVLAAPTMNLLMSLPVEDRTKLRHRLSEMLAEGFADREKLESALVYQSDVEYCVPTSIQDYTDFYCSIHHATNVGTMFRPNNPLLPNYKHIPIGYHGRASSVVISGTEVRRPVGQKTPAEEGGPSTRTASALLDYEMEVGFFIAQENKLGDTVPIEQSESRLFGMCLVNDWSARDIQKWEYVPLGPFLAKSFATTISPWVVTMQALAPFRVPAFQRADGDPTPLDYLASPSNESHGGVDIQLEVLLASQQMREQKIPAQRLSLADFNGMYWTVAQMLTHHASNGCNLQPGDLMASGTVSGPEREARGSMLELTWDGDVNNPLPGSNRTPLKLPTGEERKFIGDGDEIIMRGWCVNDSYRRIGFGECRGVVSPASV